MNTTTAHTETDHSQTDYSQADHTTGEPRPEQPPRPQPLYRPADDRMLAGVGAGIARYLSIDVTIVRVVLAVLAVAGGFGVPLYIAGWLLIPDEGHELSIAEEFIQSRAARSR
ncbi:MAG TPA: PspC domain-containing protein [Streptosporangiaceae bacterium]|nr:PspC domain-containing protein [Streptosporangiaceae bacterium]